MLDTIIYYISVPLGFLMKLCYDLLKNYGFAIIFFTLLTKMILIPLSVWVHTDSIKMVKMQPALNRIKAKFYGNKDMISDEQSKVFKANKYSPFTSLIPLAVQLILLMGVIGVIGRPLDFLLHMPKDLIDAMVGIAGADGTSSSAQLAVIEAVKGADFTAEFAALASESQFAGYDVMGYIASIKAINLSFFGINLTAVPSIVGGIYIISPIAAGISSLILSFSQNTMNVLQAEQGRLNKYGMLIFSVALSLYLGYFVAAGVALYWIASNLFAVLQLVILNIVLSPKKYVNYAELEQSRKELAALNALGGDKTEKAKENRAREKADYKRFFSIVGKHLVFYSEKSGFYKYYEGLITELLANSNVKIHYITNDPDDIIFKIAETESRIKPYYIGVKKLITLMMKIDADIVVMTTPDLEKYYIKRSFVRKDIEYIFVPHDAMSIHMGFKEGSLDAFDTIFCAGAHVENEVRETEKYYKLDEKALVKFGYPLQGKLIKAYEDMLAANEGKHIENRLKDILIAPSWQDDNLLDSCIDELIDRLYSDKFRLTIRPHPEYVKRFPEKMHLLCEKYKDKTGECLVFELDFSSNKSIYASDLVITDWSGIAYEFSFSTKKPTLFINTKMKVLNPNWDKISSVPTEISLRDKIGKSLDPDKLDDIYNIVCGLLNSSEEYREKITAVLEGHIYNLTDNGKNGAMYIINKLTMKKH